MAAPIGSGLGPTQYKGAWALEYAPAPISRVPCPCGDQPVPPAGDRAVTPRLSEPPRMPKPSGCGRRCLICNRRVSLRCGRCGRTTAGYGGLCAVSSCARRCTYAAPAIGTSRRLQSRCAVRSRLWLHSRSGNEQCENRWPSCSHERTENQLRIPPSNIVSPKHRWSHRRAVGLRRGLARNRAGQICVFPTSSPPQFSGRSRRP